MRRSRTGDVEFSDSAGTLHSPENSGRYTDLPDSRFKPFLQMDRVLPKLSMMATLSMFHETRPEEIQPLYAVYLIWEWTVCEI